MILRYGTESTEVSPTANVFGLSLISSSSGTQPEWLSSRDSFADSSIKKGSLEISWVQRNTGELYNCNRWTGRLELMNSSPAGKGI